MKKSFLGIDAGSTTIKGIVLGEDNNIIYCNYQYINNDLTKTLKKLLIIIFNNINKKEYYIANIGVTGLYRKKVAKLLNTNIIKNELYSSLIGSLYILPKVKTIIEIGATDSKIIQVKNNKLYKYKMNYIYTTNIGLSLDKLAISTNILINNLGKVTLTSKNPLDMTKISNLNNLTKKKKEDILAGYSKLYVDNYVNIMKKDITIEYPILFIGGVSKNIAIKKYLESSLKTNIVVDKYSMYIDALGVAILSINRRNIHILYNTYKKNIITNL